jgi:PAS domain-containing protein
MTRAFPLLTLLLLAPAPASAHGLADWSPAAQIATGLVAVGAVAAIWLLIDAMRRRHRMLDLLADNQRLAASNAELRLTADRAEAKARMLDGVLAAMADGVLVVDADLRLAGWNPRFPDYAGVPRRALRIGMPMREVVRLQAEGGEFGLVDPEAETERRMRLMQVGPGLERWQRERPDGSHLELRRAPLPGGGFVTLYTPVLAKPAGPPEASMAEAFRAEWLSRFPRLTAAAADGDAAAVREAAHALLGIAGNAGWSAAAAALAVIEGAAEAGNMTEVRLMTATLPSDPSAWS